MLSSPYVSVAAGVDTLICNSFALLDDSICAYFLKLRDEENNKAIAEKREAVPQDSGLSFLGEPLLVRPLGRRGWQVVLANELLDVALGRGGVGGVTVRVRCSAAYLWSRPFDQVIAELQEWSFRTFGADSLLQVSEVHIARDAMGKDVGNVWPQLRRQLVRRATLRELEVQTSEDRRGYIETVMIGRRGGKLSCTLYDKTREVKKSGKLWMHDIWAARGWVADECSPAWSPVYRLECRFTREFLAEYDGGIQTLYELIEKLDSLWAYATQKWLRHVECEPDASSDVRQRAPTSAWWVCYQAPILADEGCVPGTRSRKRLFDRQRLALQIAGCFASYISRYEDAPMLGKDAMALEFFDALSYYLARHERTFADVVRSRQARYVAA